MARQPIFDQLSKVQAYELLYRPGTGEGADTPGAAATARVILAAISDFGLDHLAGKADIHINLPGELIRSPIDIPLPPDRVVLEVLEDVQADEAVLAGIKTYRGRGFRVALDDYALAPGQGDPRLLKHVDMVKVDILAQPTETLADVVAETRGRGIRLIAEKVETREQFVRCRAMGFSGVQGFFLQRPETFQGQRTEGVKTATLQVLAALQSPDYSTEAVEKLVSRDVALVHRVLRTLNSAYYAFPAWERGDWDAVAAAGFGNPAKVRAAYLDAVAWSEETIVVTME